ncbi:MAG: Type II secretory pathway, pseudopilin PulG [Pasteurella sp.]|nr:Type II secretory pathway, pseudopilin PulG [Pasteurella sp.]
MLPISFRSFTLIETLTTLTILVISVHFISPAIFTLQDKIKLENEIKQFKAFIYQVQTQARFNKTSYSIVLSQNIQKQRWCAIAIKKKKTREKCDCLNLSSCNKFKDYLLYKNYFKNSQLKTPQIYPKSFLSIDGQAARLEEKCVKIAINQQNDVLQFKSTGIIDVISKNKKSRCHRY